MNISAVKKVIDLAKQRDYADRLYMNAYFPDGVVNLGGDQYETSPEYLEYRRCDKELDAFLFSLDYQTILDLEALMFLGREGGATFEFLRDYVGRTYPDESQKSLAIEYISSKSPLAEYLTKGLEMM